MPFRLNGRLIRARRVAAGLTVVALADQLGLQTDVIWAIETEREQDLEYLPLTMLLALAGALELRPGDLFVGHESAPIPPAADDMIIEAALREHRAGLSRDVLARGLGWPLERVNRALDVLAQRLRHAGSRLRRVSSNGYAIGARRQALTTAQWALLAQLPGTTIDLTPEAATALYQIAFGGRRLRTDTWEEADTGLCLLRTPSTCSPAPARASRWRLRWSTACGSMSMSPLNTPLQVRHHCRNLVGLRTAAGSPFP